MLVQLRKSLDALYESLEKYENAYEVACIAHDLESARKYIEIVLAIEDEIISLEAQHA